MPSSKRTGKPTLVARTSGQIEHCDKRNLRVNARFGHGTLQLGTYCVDGKVQINRYLRRRVALREALNDTGFGIGEIPDARRSKSFTARA